MVFGNEMQVIIRLQLLYLLMQFTIHRFFASTKNNIQIGSAILALSLVMLSSCQKETTGIPGTSSVTDQPPAGFVFPHTYQISANRGIFEVYSNARQINPFPIPAELYFDKSIEEILNEDMPSSITLMDKTTISIPDYPNLKYFVKNQILNVIYEDDTFEYAKGNYESFHLYYNLQYYAENKNDDQFSRTRKYGAELEPINLLLAMKDFKLNSINDIKEKDTLAIHTIKLTYN